MIVDPTHGRPKGYAKYALGAAAGFFILACDQPAQNTDLRPEGPPDVLAVLVMTDPAAQLAESATYCRTNDDKRPTTVGLPDFTLSQICDEDPSKPADMVTSAYPDGWYVRVMFDELLDPDIEELVEILDPDTGDGTDTFTGTIANTQPVILECESVGGGFVEVPYDGYYSPAGNSVTWPLGPALVIKPIEPRAIATNKMCRVTLRDSIVDKSGTAVPADQRGPYPFKIAPITAIAIDPSHDPDGTSPIDALQIYYDNVYVQFNTFVDESSFCDEGVAMDECEFSITPEDTGYCTTGGESCIIGGAACPTVGDTCDTAGYYAYSLKPYGFTESEFGFGPNAAIQSDHEYTFSFLQGGKVKDRCGVETTLAAPAAGDNTLVHFKTNKFDFKSLTPATGDTASPLKKPTLLFNNVLDPSTLETTDYVITPAPQAFVLTTSPGSGGDFVFGGNYQPATQYTFTLNAGATVTDAYGVPFVNTAEKKVTWTTQPIAITSTTPANGGTSTKSTPASLTTISISFNQNMDPATLTPADYTFTGPGGAAVPLGPAVAAASTCGPSRSSCTLELPSLAPLAPGAYKFTLNAAAQISDVITPTANVYTQAAARVVSFSVVNATPAIVCL